MPRTPRNELAQRSFKKAITEVAKTRPNATAKDIEHHIIREHNARVSDESIRKALKGEVNPLGVQVELLLGLMSFFEVAPADLGSHAEQRILSVLSLVGATHGGTDPGGANVTRDQASPPTYRLGETPGHRLALVAA